MVNEKQAIECAKAVLPRPDAVNLDKGTAKHLPGLWTVRFPLIVPDGEIWSPDSTLVLVNDSTGEASLFLSL